LNSSKTQDIWNVGSNLIDLNSLGKMSSESLNKSRKEERIDRLPKTVSYEMTRKSTPKTYQDLNSMNSSPDSIR
jgi:hypothetical protein